ncbi:hypothetical protein BLA29_005661 [Euroglyphus maynei]|uniref:Uncharacterized protein n=1 Tax=Euroglyphus maynei TaxID=6958 RepID=A0A1Y3BSJ3_EURMA|nr:hypothetical protein BLA29_005661 [Euroglyphus maynei]
MTLIKLSISLVVLVGFVATNVLAKKPNPLPSFPANHTSILNRARPKLTTTFGSLPTTRPPPTSSTPYVPVSQPALSVSDTQSLPAQSAPAVSVQEPPTPSAGQLPLVITPNQAELLDRFMGPYKGSRNVRILYDTDFQYRCLDAMNRKRLWHENTPRLVLGDNVSKIK